MNMLFIMATILIGGFLTLLVGVIAAIYVKIKHKDLVERGADFLAQSCLIIILIFILIGIIHILINTLYPESGFDGPAKAIYLLLTLSAGCVAFPAAILGLDSRVSKANDVDDSKLLEPASRFVGQFDFFGAIIGILVMCAGIIFILNAQVEYKLLIIFPLLIMAAIMGLIIRKNFNAVKRKNKS